MLKFSRLIATSAVLSLMMVPAGALARQNSLTGGVSVSYDQSNRNYDSIKDDPETEADETRFNDNREDDFKSIVVRPMVQFTSLSEKDRFELRVAPGISYDLDAEDTDLNSSLSVAADRYFTKSWQLRVANDFLRSDYFSTDNQASTEPAEASQQVPLSTDPRLSTDPGRSRYWRNTLNIFSDHHYMEDSLFQMGFGYIVLRNDDTGFGGYEDYDRYSVSLRDEHRFTPAWKSSVDLQFVRGEFDPADRADIEPVTDELSSDIKEYHLTLTGTNESIIHNPLSLSYNYIGSVYDEALLDDSDIHQMRLTWKSEISPRVYTILGLGPSYEKTEGNDANWGGNGTAELNYLVEHGSFNFLIDKRYDVSNFSGTNEKGPVDIWDTRATFNYRLQKDLSLNTSLSYVSEDREEQVVALENGSLTTRLEDYHTDRYGAGLGLNYTFLRFYSAGVNYTFTKVESDRIGDDYDDHRIFFTLSWQKELFRW